MDGYLYNIDSFSHASIGQPHSAIQHCTALHFYYTAQHAEFLDLTSEVIKLKIEQTNEARQQQYFKTFSLDYKLPLAPKRSF